VPVGAERRVYLVCDVRGPVAAVPGGNTGEDEIARAGFANCPVRWDLLVPYRMIEQALALLPRLAGQRRRVR
jgi:hypothetical protein